MTTAAEIRARQRASWAMVLEWTEARENLIDSMARTLATQHPIGEEEWEAITRAKFLIRVFPDKYNPLPGGIMCTEGRPL